MNVAHILVPYFPCQVERVHDPLLGGNPLAIGGQPWERGTVYCCSPEALRDGEIPPVKAWGQILRLDGGEEDQSAQGGTSEREKSSPGRGGAERLLERQERD